MARLATSIERIRPHYTVVVVGSGYGGGIAASRLARAGQQVCVLERGKEFQPGEYPDTPVEALPEMQFDKPEKHVGQSTGLYDFRFNDELHVLVGCGLGGGSLINANASLRPESRVFEDSRWPAALRDDLGGALEEGFGHAEEMLKPVPYPDDYPPLPKTQALEQAAAALGERFYRPPINVTFENGVNHVGVEQHACTLCGDCVSGCNYGAKNTVIMNYLPDAKNHGAEIFTRTNVRAVERNEGRWVVHYQIQEVGREKFDGAELFVTADVVVLAAGSLGSTEILLRSKARGFPVSDRLGEGFTGNGDVWGFGYNNDQPIRGIGFGNRPPGDMAPVGPCISGILDAREKDALEDGIVVEDGVLPGAMASLLPVALNAAAGLTGHDTDGGIFDFVAEKKRVLESMIRGPYHGAVNNTLTYLVMAHDDGEGRLSLRDDRVRIDWPGVGTQPIFGKINALLDDATQALGGTFVMNPIMTRAMGHGLISPHPLGGCVMAEAAADGVVDHKGQVFSSSQGKDVHDGLYVADGAVVPRPLGVNPLLTISALAERTCALIARERGWSIDYALPSAPAAAPEPGRLGIESTERMTGHFSDREKTDYRAGAEDGKARGSTIQFVVTLATDDVEQFLSDPDHKAKLVGTVTAPALAHAPLVVTDGAFHLFSPDPENVETRNMRYRMHLTSREGKAYYLEGFKEIRDDPGLDLWPDTTTLYVTLHEGSGPEDPVLGKGIMHVGAADFLRQINTTVVRNARSNAERLAIRSRLGRFFVGDLFDTFGGIFARPTVFDPEAPPRKRRPLRVGTPEVHNVVTGDGVRIRLTRYRGGGKGPVMLTHGLGVSSLIFSLDTIETNLLEYLYANGYDVWLLDYRFSIALPASEAQASGDEVARYDYPAAVARIRALTNAENIQVVAHCLGSVTFFTAMLAGLEGVRSAVCSQVATHYSHPFLTRVKAGLYLPKVLETLGVDSMTAYVDRHADWKDRLLDTALKLFPIEKEERCKSSACHRISFLYGIMYEHDQLNSATHETLHETFGVANMKMLDHLSVLAREGQLVDAEGRNTYLPHVDRLKIPIAFIHGAENAVYLPESTEKTYEFLREKNGKGLYSRHLIPNYGHIDCIFGKNADNDIYPLVLDHLERTQ